MKVDDFYEAFRNEVKQGFSEAVMHFRIRTDGPVCTGLTHPFPLDNFNNQETEGTAKNILFHNGVIGIKPPKGESDTSYFSKLMVSMRNQYDNHDFHAILELAVGSSRLVLMTKKQTHLLGDGWTDEKGLWYSNKSYVYER